MKTTDGLRQKGIFILACLSAIILIVAGFKMFSLANNDLSSGHFYLLGFILTLAGVFMASSQSSKNNMLVGFVLIALGLYQFARAAGMIEYSWLAIVAGIGCIVSAIIAVYSTFPRKDQMPTKSSNDAQ